MSVLPIATSNSNDSRAISKRDGDRMLCRDCIAALFKPPDQFSRSIDRSACSFA